MELKLITAECTEWKNVIEFADVCSWSAGKFLADKMRKNNFKDWVIKQL